MSGTSVSARPNLHVALALALGVQPHRSDAQLIAEVERLRARVEPAMSHRVPQRAAAAETLFDLEEAS